MKNKNHKSLIFKPSLLFSLWPVLHNKFLKLRIFNVFDLLRGDFQRHEKSILNPALWAVLNYRFGRWGLSIRVAPVHLLVSIIYGINKYIILYTGNIRLHRRTKVGEDIQLVHIGNILIHKDAVIGDRCRIQHNVTLAANMDKHDGAPIIGNDVFIGTGAVILGGITIGDGARIAANSLVITDVPPGATAIGVPARMMKYTGRSAEI